MFQMFGPARSVLAEDAFIKELGKIRSELGEIQEIYDDFQELQFRIIELIPQINDEQKKWVEKANRRILKALSLLEEAEDDLLLLTKEPKPPRRKRLPKFKQANELPAEMARISTNIGMLSVRIRNIGQATGAAEIKRLNIKSTRDKFEEASEIIRKAFVDFEKAIP